MASSLYELHEIEIMPFPGDISEITSDHTVFYSNGITVILLIGLHKHENGDFWLRANHTPQDCLEYINETDPGMVERAMWSYSLFLERMLLHRYESEAYDEY